MSENVENPQNEESETEAEMAQEQDQDAMVRDAETSEEDEFKKKFFYLAAEMENMKKRYEREKDNLLKYGNEKVLSALIEVVDNLERTMQALENDKEEKIVNIMNGVTMVRDQFLATLKKHGLEAVESVGKSFDPNFHEALAQQPAEGQEDDTIILEYQKGYVLNGRLVRASKVVVVKN
jgi:molecular chaperone GrpE